jgi:hypothetical protein
MSKLTVLRQWAITTMEEVFAHLSLILLLQSKKVALISIKVIEITLLGEMSHYFAWGVVKVLLWLSVLVKLSSVSRLTVFPS